MNGAVMSMMYDVNDLVAGGAVGKCVSTAEFPHLRPFDTSDPIRPHNSYLKSSLCGS